MATKIRGVTVEIGGDTSGLSKALKNTNSEIKNTQNQLKDVEKLLKLDPSNIELLEQKQKLLGDRVKETSEKLKTLREAEAQLKESGVDQNSEQFMALQREIKSTEESLKKAKSEAENFNVSMEKASAQLNDFSEKAQNVADKTKALSAVAGGVVAGLGGMAVKAMKASDDLNTLAQQSGFTTEELQKFEYASEMVDVSTETITGAITKMRRNMNSTSSQVQEAWQRIGVSITNANGEMRDSTEVFYDAVEALSKVGNETERDQLAMQLFGKSADQLAGIIDDGGRALREYGIQAEETGKIWSQESIDASNAINDIIDTLKADISQTILITGAKALQALQPIIENVAEKISGLLNWIGSLDEKTLKIILTVATVVASISPIASIISKITGAVGNFLTFVPKITKAFSAVTSFATANPMMLIAVAVATAVLLIIKHWDEIKESAKKTWDFIKTKMIDPMVEGFQKLRDKVKEIWNAIVDHIKERINKMIDFVNGFIEVINKLIQKLNNSGLGKALNININQIGNIPQLANGGVLTSGSAIVGERGAELLTVSSGKAKVEPLNNTGSVVNYNFNVDNIATYNQIERKLENQRLTQRMGYVGV